MRPAPLRVALERVDRLLQQWAHTGHVPPEDAEAAATQVEGLGDKVLEARAQLLLAAAGAGLREPGLALHGLGQALRVFEANLMAREHGQALLLGASLLIDAGRAPAALVLLADIDPDGVGPTPGHERLCQRLALRACALLEQGRLDDAVTAARAANDALDPVRASPRVHTLVAALCAEVLLAARLHGLGAATHLDLYVGTPAGATAAATHPAQHPPPAPAGAPALRDIKALREWLAGPSLEAASLLLLEAAAAQPGNPALLADLGRLATRAAGDFSRSGSLLWLRLGTAYRLQAQHRLAADALRRALTLGNQAGQERLTCRAHFELLQVLASLGDFAGAFSSQSILQASTVRRLTTPPRTWPEDEAPRAGTASGTFTDGTTPDPLPSRGPALHVRRARAFMTQQLGQPVTVIDVARHCGVSRRTLELAFRSELGTTVADCLRGLRLQAVKQRLVHTDLPIKRIAHDLGYSSASSLSREFRRSSGQAPVQYRKRAGVG